MADPPLQMCAHVVWCMMHLMVTQKVSTNNSEEDKNVVYV